MSPVVEVVRRGRRAWSSGRFVTPSLQWWRRLSAVERMLARSSSGRGESNLRTRTNFLGLQISHFPVKSHSGLHLTPSFNPGFGTSAAKSNMCFALGTSQYKLVYCRYKRFCTADAAHNEPRCLESISSSNVSMQTNCVNFEIQEAWRKREEGKRSKRGRGCGWLVCTVV